MYRIVTNTFERKLYYKNTVVLKYKIEYPQILGNSFGIHRFNRFNFIKAIRLKQYSEKNLFKEAKELYDFNVSNGYPVMVYEIVSDFTVTLNKKPCISIYSDDYMFTGGAHGTTTRMSQNWNIQTGNQINLNELFDCNCDYVLYILKDINNQIEEQIANETNYYFDNYCNLVLNSIDLNSFYLDNKYVNIYFQQYDIAPYSSGIPTFQVTSLPYRVN